MRIPISWLNEYVDVSDLSVQELSDKLTFVVLSKIGMTA